MRAFINPCYVEWCRGLHDPSLHLLSSFNELLPHHSTTSLPHTIQRKNHKTIITLTHSLSQIIIVRNNSTKTLLPLSFTQDSTQWQTNFELCKKKWFFDFCVLSRWHCIQDELQKFYVDILNEELKHWIGLSFVRL